MDTANSFLCWLKKGRRVTPPAPGPVKVNLGPGLHTAPGWINVDASPNALFAGAPKWLCKLAWSAAGAKKWYSFEEYHRILSSSRYLHHNLKWGLPFSNSCVDYIYSSHLLEHLFEDEARFLLSECARVLKPGGLIRLVVPDLEYALKLYQEGKKDKAMRFFFPTSRSGELGRHRYMYDFEMLKERLEAAGFSRVTRCSFREGECPDIDILDIRPQESLYVEAHK